MVSGLLLGLALSVLGNSLIQSCNTATCNRGKSQASNKTQLLELELTLEQILEGVPEGRLSVCWRPRFLNKYTVTRQ